MSLRSICVTQINITPKDTVIADQDPATCNHLSPGAHADIIPDLDLSSLTAGELCIQQADTIPNADLVDRTHIPDRCLMGRPEIVSDPRPIVLLANLDLTYDVEFLSIRRTLDPFPLPNT